MYMIKIKQNLSNVTELFKIYKKKTFLNFLKISLNVHLINFNKTAIKREPIDWILIIKSYYFQISSSKRV